MYWINETEKVLGEICVGVSIVDVSPDDIRFEVVVEDPIGCLIARAQASFRDLVNLMIATRETLELGAVTLEAAPGWSGYWFLLDDDHAVMVTPKAFRRIVDALELESRELVRSRFRLT